MAVGKGVSVTKNAAISKSNAAQSYLGRIIADSGTIGNIGRIRQWIGTAQANGFFDPTQMLIAPIFSYKERISAPYSFLSKLYSLRLAANDAAQTTEVNQLYKAGYIAQNEVLSAKVPNGDSRFLTHPAISFAANEAWSIAFVFNDNSSSNTLEIASTGSIVLYTKVVSARICLYSTVNNNGVRAALNGLSAKIGKTNIIHCVADGVNVPKIFYNGVEASLEPGFNTELIYGNFTQLYTGDTANSFFGKSHYYRIQSGAMTPAQITAEYDLLRSWIPEIESVQIGSQTWATSNLAAVATPLGNVIPEVQLAATWATATTLYDNAYAAASGDAAAKHYAGVKAAAMWCYFDNSTANGAIYGKILNGYAIKLLRLDMITANYGYKPPLQADWDDLETYLGVDAGNDVKHNGTTFWSAPNGGTNSSGLTILPGGYRNELGAFIGLNDEVYMITADESDDRVGGYARLIKD